MSFIWGCALFGVGEAFPNSSCGNSNTLSFPSILINPMASRDSLFQLTRWSGPQESRNGAFNTKCANYPSLRDARLCFSKVRLILYIKLPKSLSKPLGPPEFQNCFFFLFWHFRKAIWGIHRRKHHTPRGNWSSRPSPNTVFPQGGKNEYLH